MPRSLAITRKRSKHARSANAYYARRKILQSIENADHFVEEDSHIKYFENLPDEELPDLCMETENAVIPKLAESELRLVSPSFFLEQAKAMFDHDQKCTMGKYRFKKERREGLMSILSYYCQVCETTYNLRCVPSTPTTKQNVNTDCVWGLMSIGSGYNQGEELFSIMNVPFMKKATYSRYERKVATTWESSLVGQMKDNANLEKKLAVEAGDLEDGIPFITVIVDGGWAKRSYGHGYSSLSGVACIIGKRTKKLLHLGIKNKFCYVCATNNDLEHRCYKNFDGPSTSMEQAIIVEGFNLSEDNYGIRYKFMIGDGDSSVYCRVLQHVSYGRKVMKLECANHVTRACISNLYILIKNKVFDSKARELIKLKLNNYSKYLRYVISKSNNSDLKNNLKNVPFHVFGDHENCKREICRKPSVNQPVINLLDSAKIWCEILKINDRVVNKAGLLSQNVTTNFAERFMAIVAKFTGGKRFNLIERGGYNNRCYGAGLSYNSGYEFHKLSTAQNKEKKNLTTFCTRRRKRKLLQNKYYKKPNKILKVTNEDCDYGSDSAEPDKSETELENSKLKIMNELEVANIKEVQIKTLGQANNIEWIKERRMRLTASCFGKICKLKDTTRRTNVIKQTFYRNELINTAAIRYGVDNEPVAIKKFEKKLGLKVNPCGLFICKKFKFLGASPDGIISENVIVEVKCLHSIKNFKIRDCLEKSTICVGIGENEKLFLKPQHNYMYQIQGQLYIAQKKSCMLILYTDVDLEVIKVDFDQAFCDKMMEKLCAFWHTYVLPELADPRIPRGKDVRNEISKDISS